jgi:hypothetical protein
MVKVRKYFLAAMCAYLALDVPKSKLMMHCYLLLAGLPFRSAGCSLPDSRSYDGTNNFCSYQCANTCNQCVSYQCANYQCANYQRANTCADV